MLTFHNIWNVARIETKTLWRSWFFRIFSLLALVVLFFFNIGVFTKVGNSPWMFRAIPATMPYVNLLMLNIVQAAIAVFLASDFLKRDKKLDTTEVIYMRSMSNFDYVLGKTLGILFVFMALNIVVLLMALIFNFFFADIPVNLAAYFWYPVLISFPTLIFILGLSFLFMVIIRNQPVTFVVLLGYIAVTSFFLSLKYYHLFDYMAYQVPLQYSDFVGFGGFENLLIHRGMYFSLGLGFVFATILMIKRLPQSRTMTGIAKVFTVIFLVIGFGLGYVYVAKINAGKDLRVKMLTLNDNLYQLPRVNPLKYRIDLNHDGENIESAVMIKYQNSNQQPLSEFVFSLNPGLKIDKIEDNSGDVQFERDLQIIKIKPSKPLAVNSIDSLKFTYRGKIDDRACYLDINEEAREQNYRYWMCVVNKRYSFIRPDYVLLTPENLWYPVPGINFNSEHPEIHPRDFSTYRLTVTTDSRLTAISQGKMTKKGDGTYEFVPEIRLPNLSLVIGEYEKKSIQVDSVDFNLYLKPGHDYFSEQLTEIGDTLSALVKQYKEDYEADLELPYLYSKLDIIETPIQLFSYKRIWTLSQESVQPEMVLLPEKAVLIDAADFKRRLRWSTRGRGGRGMVSTPKETQSRIFRGFVNETFLGGEMRGRFMRDMQFYLSINYKIFPNYFNFVNQIKSDRWPIFSVALEAFLSSRASSSFFRGFSFGQSLSVQDKTNIELSEKTLSELIADPEKRQIIHDVIKEKSSNLFAMLQYYLGEDELDNFLESTLKENRFKELDVTSINTDLKKRYGFDAAPFLDNWYNSKKLPGFLTSEVESFKIMDGDRTRYQVIFTVSNTEPTEGILKLSFRMGGGRGMMGFGQSENVERVFRFEGNQTKMIGVVLDAQPRMMTINTMISKNLPAQDMVRFEDMELHDKASPFDGERILNESLTIIPENTVIVDNEDPGFEAISPKSTSFVKRVLKISNDNDKEKYINARWRPPSRWRATIDADFYGKLVKSAHFIKSGSGDKKAVWKANIPSNGYYEIYYHFHPIRSFDFRRMRGGDRGRNRESGEYHFTVFHDDGQEEVTLELRNAEDGWNLLGSFYISEGETRVELSDLSRSRIVIADAVKWVKR